MLLELGYILVKIKQPMNCYFDLEIITQNKILLYYSEIAVKI